MEMHKESMVGKKKRRLTLSRPILVRSAKPGQVLSASYTRQSFYSLPWRA